jgi:hypothetical protein
MIAKASSRIDHRTTPYLGLHRAIDRSTFRRRGSTRGFTGG